MSGGPCGSVPAAAIPSAIRGANASKSARDSQKSMIPQPPSIGPEAWKSSPLGGVRSGLTWSWTWSNCSWVIPGSLTRMPTAIANPLSMESKDPSRRVSHVAAGRAARPRLSARWQIRGRNDDAHLASVAQTPAVLVLVLPVVELGPRASEDDPFAGDAPRADLARVEVLDDVRRDQRGEHEDADGCVRVVADLVRALLAARERDDVALAQLLLALVRAQRRLAAEDDRPFLVRMVGVEWPLLVPRLDLVHARADQFGVGVRADPGVLEAPALALFRAIPLISVEIEDLHAASLVARFERT